MITWILILYVQNYGPALTSVPGFQSQRECIEAGLDVRKLQDREVITGGFVSFA